MLFGRELESEFEYNCRIINAEERLNGIIPDTAFIFSINMSSAGNKLILCEILPEKRLSDANSALSADEELSI